MSPVFQIAYHYYQHISLSLHKKGRKKKEKKQVKLLVWIFLWIKDIYNYIIFILKLLFKMPEANLDL